MTRNGRIRRLDGQTLGNPDHVKARLGEAFPGVRFVLVTGGNSRPFDLSSLSSVIFSKGTKERQPYWTGGFEGKKFLLAFSFDDQASVQSVRLDLYGRGVREAAEHFDKLSTATGWAVSL